MEKIELLVLLDVGGLKDEQKFEKHIKKEGFKAVEKEKHVYMATSSTTTFATKAYILEVFKKGLEKAGFEEANLVFLLNETPYPPYYYDKQTGFFEEVKEKK